MKFELIPNWKEVLLYAHSMWANYLGIGALLTPEAIYLLTSVDTDPKVWFGLAVVFFLYGTFGRLLNQKVDETQSKDNTTVRSPAIIGLLALSFTTAFSVMSVNKNVDGYLQFTPTPTEFVETNLQTTARDREFLSVVLPLIGKWEGLRLVAYQDIVGVWTVCYGETKGVRPGHSYTKSQCDEMLAREVMDYRYRLHKAMTPDTLKFRLPALRDAAFTSVSYNVGVGTFSKSTAVKRLNAGDIAGACEGLTWWNKAGGRIIRGLVNRRTEEHSLCMAGTV